MPLEKIDNSVDINSFSLDQKVEPKPTLIKVSDDLRPSDINSFEMSPEKRPDVQKQLLETGDLDTAMRLSKGDLAYSLSLTRGIAPDQAAKVAKVAGALKLPKDTVERNLVSAEDILASKEILTSIGEQDDKGNYKYPFTLAWLSNKDKMAQAKDDVNALAEMELLLKRNKQDDEGILKKSARAFAAGSLDLANTLAKSPGYLQDMYYETIKNRAPVLKDVKFLKSPDYMYNNLVTKWLNETSQDIKPIDVDESAIALIKEGQYAQAAKNVYLNTVLNAPNLLLMLGVSAATSGAAGLAVAGLTSATSSFSDDKEAGRDRSDAALASVLKGGAEAGFEYVTLGNFKRLFGGLGKKLTKEVGEDAANITLKGAFDELLKDSVSEGVSEYATTVTQDLADYFTGKKDALDGTQERALNSLLVGGLSGGIMAGAGVVAQSNAQVLKIRRSYEDMDRVNQLVTEGKLKTRNEDLLGDFVKTVTGENVYVPLNAVETLFQNDPLKVKTFAEALGITPEELKSAQDNGTDLEISKDKFVSKIMGTEIYDGLKDKIRYGVDGLTMEEATQLENTLKQDVIDAQESFKEIRENKQLPDKLIAMKSKITTELNMNPKDADAQLAVLYAVAKTFAAKQGKTIDEYLNDVELRIKPKFEEGDLNQSNVIDTPEFKNFFEGSKVVDSENKPLAVYHGTVTDFNTFDKARANIENDFGKGFYFTDNQNDVEANYSGIDPDMENKISRRAERIESDSDGELTYDQAKEIAKKELVQNEGKTLEVYLAIKNPAVLGGSNPTNFDFNFDEDTGEETGTLIDFINSLRTVSVDFGDVDIDRAIGDMLEQNPDGGNLEDLIDSLKKSEGLAYATDNETGDLASSEVIRSALEDMGFDGIIDNTVDVKFGSQRRTGKAMAGIDPDTTHYIVFKSEQIKSVDNKGTFNPGDPNIYNQTDPLGFYSKLSTEVEKMDFKAMPAKDLLNRVKKLGLKQDELDYTGIVEFLQANEGKVTKDEVVNFLKNGGVKLEEVVKGKGTVNLKPNEDEPDILEVYRADDPNGDYAGAVGEIIISGPNRKFGAGTGKYGVNVPGLPQRNFKTLEEARKFIEDNTDLSSETKYQNYVEPGSENYREVLLTLPPEAKPTDWKLEVNQEETDYQDDGETYYNVVDQNGTARFTGSKQEADQYMKEEATSDRAGTSRVQTFKSSHFDTPNILAHFRLSDHNFGETLFIEEIQSDWHQQGRDKGYFKSGDKAKIQQEMDALQKERDAVTAKYTPKEQSTGNTLITARINWNEIINSNEPKVINGVTITPEEARKDREREKEISALNSKLLGKSLAGVPDAPFKQTEAWAMLAFKRILRMAVERGYTAIEWTTGEQQADRYDLSKQIDEITYSKDRANNTYDVVIKKDGSVIGFPSGTKTSGLTVSEMSDLIGKEAAHKIEAETGKEWEGGSKVQGKLEGLDLKVGGEGMKGFYDYILPKAVDKYISKIDKTAKIEKNKYWGIPITDAIKAEVMKGQSLFQKGSNPKGSIQFKEDGKTIINLYENSDFSTLLHETGHLFTKELKSLVDSGTATEQDVKDYNTLLAHADGKLDRNGHEKIARSFENYLREGVAPSVALRDAFRRIKTWLVNIYRSLAGLNAPINDEVRAVFDRMLASEAEIAEAEAYRKSKQIAESFFKNAPLTEKQKLKMEDLRKEAHEQALEIQTAKTLQVYFKAIGSLSADPEAKTVTKISEGKNLLKDQAKNDVNEMRVYKIINQAQEVNGLNRQEFEAYAGKQATIDTLRRFPDIFKGGSNEVSLDAIAIDNEYESTEAMVRDISTAKPKTEAYDDRYKHLLAVREAQIKDALRATPITFEGEEALYNDAAMEYLVEEAKILAGIRAAEKGQSANRYNLKAYKDAAKQAVGILKVKDAIRFDKYVAKERQFSKELSKALNAGDTKAAQEAKEKQLRNNALVLASVEAKEILDKKLKAMNKVAKAPKGTILGPYHDAILALLNAHNISDRKPNRPDKVDYNAIIKEIEQGVDPIAFPDIAKNLNSADYKTMSFEDFEGIAQAVNILAARGRNTIRLNKEGKTMTIEEKVAESIVPMENRKPVKELKKNSPFYRIGKLYRGLLAETMHIQFDLKRVDGYEGLGLKNAKQGPNEEMFDLIFRKQKDASQAFVNFNSERLKPIGDELKAISERLNTGKSGISIPGVIMPPLLADNGFTGWTPEMIVSVALNAGNEGNLDGLMKGYGMTLSEVKAVMSQLTEKELGTIQKIWDAVDSLFTDMDEVHYRQNGFRLKKVEPKEIEVQAYDESGTPRFVTLKGGYYPIAHDPELSRKVAGYTEADIMKNESLAIHHRSKPRDSMTKERKGSKLPIKLSIQPLYKHIKDTINYTNLAEVLNDVHKVIKNDKYANQYTKLMGKERYDIITPWLSSIARPEPVVDGSVDHILNRYQRLTAIGALGVSFLSFAKQTTSLVAAMRDIQTKHLLYGMGMVIKNPIAAIKDVETRSIFMRDRQSKVQQEIAKVLEGIDPFRKKVEIFGKELSVKDLQEFALVNIRMGDILGSYPAWIGAYAKKINEGKTETEAVHFADKLISETQPTASALFNNLWQQGGPKSSASGRMVRWVVAPFTGWTMKFGSRSRTYWTGWREGKVSNKDFFEHVLYERVLTPALVATMTLMYSGLDDKEPLEEYLYEVLGYQLSWIPGINQIPGMVKYGARGKLMEIPAATTVRLGAKAVISAGKTLQGEQDFIEFVKALGYIAEFETGIPAMKAAKDIKKTSDAIIRMTE